MSGIIVKTQVGKVRGTIEKGAQNYEFYAFKGIPYAKPPIGELRFRDPVPVEPWSGIREATTYGSCCAQFDFFTKELRGGDDCLYLNVYTKDIKFRVGRPVIFWIHGGLFLFGSGDDVFYGPDYFLRKDIVLVTFNHRLGVFGFLNLDDEEASGNQGLKDQVMVLEWVRDNIAYFGGDPGNLTVAGLSSGAASAHFLTVSPLAEALFHKAIFHSGVMLNPWAFHSDPKKRAYQLCEFLGHHVKDSKSIIEFLRTVDAQQLALAQEKIETKEEKAKFLYSFGPSIDSKSKKPFLPVHPSILAANGIRVPLIIGQTNREGLFYLKIFAGVLMRFDREIDKILHPDAIAALKKLYNQTPEGFKHIYFKSDPVTEDSLEKLVDLYGDLYFVEGIQRVVKTQIEKSCSPTYYYQFSYDENSLPAGRSTKRRMRGVGHASDLKYFFETKYFWDSLEIERNDLEKCQITEQVIELWTNFASTGNPNPKTLGVIPVRWQPVGNKMFFNYLDINKELRMDTMLSLEHRYVAHDDTRIKI